MYGSLKIKLKKRLDALSVFSPLKNWQFTTHSGDILPVQFPLSQNQCVTHRDDSEWQHQYLNEHFEVLSEFRRDGEF